MRRRTALAAGLGVAVTGCAGLPRVPPSDATRRLVVDAPTHETNGVRAETSVVSAYATNDSPPVIETTVSNTADGERMVGYGGHGLLGTPITDPEGLYLFGPDATVEPIETGRWVPADETAATRLAVGMLVFERLAPGEELTRRHELWADPEATDGYPTGRFTIDGERLHVKPGDRRLATTLSVSVRAV